MAIIWFCSFRVLKVRSLKGISIFKQNLWTSLFLCHELKCHLIFAIPLKICIYILVVQICIQLLHHVSNKFTFLTNTNKYRGIYGPLREVSLTWRYSWHPRKLHQAEGQDICFHHHICSTPLSITRLFHHHSVVAPIIMMTHLWPKKLHLRAQP